MNPGRYRVVALCVGAIFICYMDRVNMSVAAMAIQDQLGWSESVKGFVLSAFFIGYLAAQIPAGMLVARLGGAPVLLCALLGWSACTALTPLATHLSFSALIAIRIAMGAAEAGAFPACYDLFSRVLPADERSRAIALLLSGVTLGSLVALSTAGWIVSHYDWPMMFYAFGALGLLWAILWAADRGGQIREISGPARHSPEPISVPWRALLAKPAVRALIVNHFCSNWNLYMFMAWLPSYFRKALGLPIAGAGLAAAAPWLTMFVASNVGGWLADRLIVRGVSVRRTRKLMQTTGLLGSSFCLILIRDVHEPGSALLIMCTALAALALTWSGFSPNHLDIAPRYAGPLMSVTNTAGTLPGIVGVSVTGWLVERSGAYSSAFLLAAAVSTVGAIVWLAFAEGSPVLESSEECTRTSRTYCSSRR